MNFWNPDKQAEWSRHCRRKMCSSRFLAEKIENTPPQIIEKRSLEQNRRLDKNTK